MLVGRKVICLCITEPTAGSDVAGVRTMAVDKGDHFIVSGTKKWITNGIYADYFTVPCRTGEGAAGAQVAVAGLSSALEACVGAGVRTVIDI